MAASALSLAAAPHGTAAAAGAGSTGLLSALGGPVGLALGAASVAGLFGKSKKPATIVPILSAKSKKLKGELFESVLFPENLALPFIGAAKRVEGARRRAFKTSTAGAGFRGPETAVGGNVARGFLGETAARFEGAQTGIRKTGEFRRGREIDRLSNLQNIINFESRKPLALAQATSLQDEFSQLRGAEQGAAIGSLAQLAVLSRQRT